MTVPVKRYKDNSHSNDSKKKMAVVLSDQQEEVNRERVLLGKDCPYIDTINRAMLDFDFEKLCSISLSHLNVYACLVCGKYFQGRAQNSHAYTHSIHVGHHVFLNLQTLKFYCLPDAYQFIDSSLDDIKYVLKPTFSAEHIASLDTSDEISRAYDGSLYLPGIVGLNNIKANDYCNVILQAFSQVSPLRNFFLCEENYNRLRRPPGDIMIQLVQRFGELLRKLWNPRSFKAHVSPHEMLQSVVYCSKKKFQFTEQGNPVEFLSWFLNALHFALNGGKRKKNGDVRSSVIFDTFQGQMRISSRKVMPLDLSDEKKKELSECEEYKATLEEKPFLYLLLDIPTPPLYKDEMQGNVIPQVSLASLLSKFNGVVEKEVKTYKDSTMKKYQLTKLPPFLILCFKRFSKNNFYLEKNPTIVTFPIRNTDMREFLSSDPDIQKAHPKTVYHLIANIVHDSLPGQVNGTYRLHILHKVSNKWFELQDLSVKEILPQMITLSESYIQIYELEKR